VTVIVRAGFVVSFELDFFALIARSRGGKKVSGYSPCNVPSFLSLEFCDFLVFSSVNLLFSVMVRDRIWPVFHRVWSQVLFKF